MAFLRRFGFALGLPIVLFALWWLTSASSTDFYFPPLSRIIDSLVEEWFGPRLAADVLPSLMRLAAGYREPETTRRAHALVNELRRASKPRVPDPGAGGP